MKRLNVVMYVMALVFATAASAEVKLASIFHDNMVIQQEMPIRVWGTANPDTAVIVQIRTGGKGAVASAKAGKDGRWRVDLEPMKADGKSHTLSVKSGEKTIELKNVVLGEVWICSGQSNMEWAVSRSLNAKEEIAAAKHPDIRMFNVPRHIKSQTPNATVPGSWVACSPQTVAGFSAVGYYFGRSLHKELNVPIGLVGTNWGGTRIEPWTPPVGFDAVPALKAFSDAIAATNPKTEAGRKANEAYIAQVEAWVKNAKAQVEAGKAAGSAPGNNVRMPAGATEIYNGMVDALTPFSVRGAIWYQGESNAGDGLGYAPKKEALVKGWRSVFENEDLSFYWVQLADFQQPNTNPEGGGWGPVREGQRRALKVPNTGMAVIIDIGAARNIHPGNKQDVGKRLALWALAKNYGKEIVYSGPMYKNVSFDGDTAVVSFDHVGSGLVFGTKTSGLDPMKPTDEPCKLFAVQGEDGRWHWANAEIKDDTVVLKAEGVTKLKAVRYAYQSNPTGPKLYNKDGLPASPFSSTKK